MLHDPFDVSDVQDAELWCRYQGLVATLRLPLVRERVRVVRAWFDECWNKIDGCRTTSDGEIVLWWSDTTNDATVVERIFDACPEWRVSESVMLLHKGAT